MLNLTTIHTRMKRQHRRTSKRLQTRRPQPWEARRLPCTV